MDGRRDVLDCLSPLCPSPARRTRDREESGNSDYPHMRRPQRKLLALLAAALSIIAADDFTVKFDVMLEGSTRGSFVVTVREKKAPIAARRFRELVNSGFYDGCSFYRVVTGFIVQFGLSGNTTLQKHWDALPMRDETRIETPDWNMRGTIAFVNNGGPNTRGTQLFVNYDDNHALDAKGPLAPVPFGRVVSGMNTLSAVYAGYRERPKASSIRLRGDAYLHAEFPKLSYIVRAQQVAFVEEPFVLSKNATGLLLTLAMVCSAGICCTAIRVLAKRAVGYNKTGADDSLHGADDDFDEGEEGDEPFEDEPPSGSGR